MLYRVNMRNMDTQNIVFSMVDALSADEAFFEAMDEESGNVVPVSAVPIVERACLGGNCDE